ncbi:hypothetical protein FGB62_99g09 [Gracilaria domingensis]|nr:hypothetical protein FGB62_99g09 [Gracilaria domingensis]
MGPQRHAADALDNIESMLDALLDDDAGAIPKPPTCTKTSKQPVKKVSKQQQRAEHGAHQVNGSHPQKTATKPLRKGRARVKSSPPKPAIRKRTNKQNKDVIPSTQNRKSTRESDSGERGGHPSEEADDLQFLQDLKRMAERRRQVRYTRYTLKR